MPTPIYLDHNATTPVIPQVISRITRGLEGEWGNPSSSHPIGQRAKEALEQARQEVAGIIGANPNEIIFTSGGTESNNLAILGTARAYKDKGKHLITTRIEHPSVLNPFIRLMEEGFQVDFIPPDPQGIVDPALIQQAIRPDTILCSVMAANNETGALQPVDEIGKICRQRGVIFHTDAAQAVGKIDIKVTSEVPDLLTMAGHKLYAPKGIGALYIRRGLTLENILYGAGQERGIRPGTEPVQLASGLGAACSFLSSRVTAEAKRLSRLKEEFWQTLKEGHGDVILFCPLDKSLPNTLAVSFPGTVGAEVLDRAQGIMASTGAACHDRSVTMSHVLAAMKVDESVALGMIRLSMGLETTREDIKEAATILLRAVKGCSKG